MNKKQYKSLKEHLIYCGKKNEHLGAFVLGSFRSSYRVPSFPWSSTNLPNLAEFRLGIVVPEFLSQYKYQTRAGMIAIRNQLSELLDAGGIIICILCKEEKIIESMEKKQRKNRGFQKVVSFNNYSWFPGSIILDSSRRGVKVQKNPSPLDPYLDKVEKWGHTIEAYTVETLQTTWGIEEVILAQNNYERTIAVCIETDVDPPGRILFLPPPTKTSTPEGIEVLLRDVAEVLPKPQSPPNWSKSIYLTGEEDLLKKIEAKNHQIKSLKDDKTRLREELRRLIRHKTILYEQGQPLEDSVLLLLSEMGITARKQEKKGIEDLILDISSLEAKVEVTGSRGSCTLKDLRQLAQWVDDARLVEEKEHVKGIFILNHFCDKPPERKGNPYPPNCLSFAEERNFCLITTSELFKAYDLFLRGEIDRNYIERKLTETVGVCVFSTT